MKTNPPYSQSGIAGDDIIMARKGSIRVAVASCSDPDTRAFIIHACNNHERLVDALQSFVTLYNQDQLQIEGDNGNDPVVIQARAVLKEINT